MREDRGTDGYEPPGQKPSAVRIDATGAYLAGQRIAGPFQSVVAVRYHLQWQAATQRWAVTRPGELRVQSWGMVARAGWGLRMAAWWLRRRGPRPSRVQARFFNNTFYGG